MPTVICHYCHEPYNVKPSRVLKTRYCSMKCKAAGQGHPNTFVCQHCKKPYKKQPSQIGKTKYCSNKCRAAAYRRPEIHCKGCRILFTPTRDAQVYCAPHCRKKNAGKTRMHRVEKRCIRCGKPLQVQWSRRHRKNYCSIECRSIARRIKNRPTPDQLKHLVVYLTYEQIAKQYEVCAGTVMNWARADGTRSPCWKKSPGRQASTIYGYIGEAYGI